MTNRLIALGSREGRVVIAATVLGSAVAMLTATVVNVALPSIGRELGAASSQQQWLINAYLLTLASLILIGGSLGDRYGRVRVYRIGVVWFAAASLLCAVAPTIEVLIVARLLQGIGGALLTPGSLSIIEATLDEDDRDRGVGMWSGLIGIAGAVGPLVGGILLELSWRWVFVINIPIALAVLALLPRVPESSEPGALNSRLDLGGAGLAALALGGISYVLIQGPEGGFEAVDVVVLAGSLVAIAALILYERRQDHPMVPIELFASRPFTAANTITLLVYGGMGIVFFLLSIQLQVTAGWSPLLAGTALIPATVLMLLFSAKAGDLSHRIGPAIPLTIGSLLIASGMLLLTRIGPGASFTGDVLPGVAVFGFGLVATVAPVTATALGSVPEIRAGAASGTNNAVARTGQLMAVAAVPALVGLTGDGLSDPIQLDTGFPKAMLVAAGLVAGGAVVAGLLLRATDPGTKGRQRDDTPTHHVSCPVDGTHPRPIRTES